MGFITALSKSARNNTIERSNNYIQRLPYATGTWETPSLPFIYEDGWLPDSTTDMKNVSPTIAYKIGE
jgi:hypothetical protein